MVKQIDLDMATDEELVAILLNYWHIDSLSFAAEFHYNEANQAV